MANLKDKAQNILNEKITKIIPENIKDGVNVFDITGTNGKGIFSELQKITSDKSFKIKFKNEESLQQAFDNEKTAMIGLGITNDIPAVMSVLDTQNNSRQNDLNPIELINQLNVFNFTIGKDITTALTNGGISATAFDTAHSNPMLVIGNYASNQFITKYNFGDLFENFFRVSADETTQFLNVYAICTIPYLGVQKLENPIWHIGNDYDCENVEPMNVYITAIVYIDQTTITWLTDNALQDRHTEFVDIPNITEPGWYRVEMNIFPNDIYNCLKVTKNFEMELPIDMGVLSEDIMSYFNNSIIFSDISYSFDLGKCSIFDGDIYQCTPTNVNNTADGLFIVKGLNCGPLKLQNKFNTFVETYFDNFGVIDYVNPETFNLYLTVNNGEIEANQYNLGFCDETGNTIYYSFDPSQVEYIADINDYSKLTKVQIPISTLHSITKNVFPYFGTVDKETNEMINFNKSEYNAVCYLSKGSCIFIDIPMPV